MKHILIVTGGHLNMEFAKAYIKTLSFDKVFAVDKGLEYTETLGLVPMYVIGDFDTVDGELLSRYEHRIETGELVIKVERHPAQKDATDTELALEVAIREGATKITILGGTGSRIDHVLSNLYLLSVLQEKGVSGCIVDETNRIQMLSDTGRDSLAIEKGEQFGRYISLLPISETVEGLTLKGAEYPLENATIYRGKSIGVSNQRKGDIFSVSIRKGSVFVIESRDCFSEKKTK